MSHRIMIVEDDPVIAGSMSKFIAGWGHEVHIAKNLRDIMPEFEAFGPQLMLLDISLPFFDGYHWCQEIRKTSQIPVIFLRLGKPEHYHGHQHGRGRFHCQAL